MSESGPGDGGAAPQRPGALPPISPRTFLKSTLVSVYASLGTLAERYATPAAQSPGDLTRHELRVFSQNGEDGVICELLRRVGTETEYFVEFGAESGAEGNCVFLAEVLAWHGLFIEPSDQYDALERRWAGRPPVATARAFVTPENVGALFREHGVPESPDLVSIDIDGNDYWVWEAMETTPRVLVVEYNGNLDTGPDVRLVQPYSDEAWDRTDFFGASLGALESLGRRKGYRLVHTDLAGSNAFFVRDDLAGELPSGDLVPRRAANYRLGGRGHRPDPRGREYRSLSQ
jgi:hypothetical protein